MKLNLEEIETIDETMEAILELVRQETDWKNNILKLDTPKTYNETHADILNIEGRMRLRISDLLRELVNDEIDKSWTLPEDREPEFDPHELD